MQIGFNLPNSGPLSEVGAMTHIATQGEAMGFDYLTMTDHVVLPDTKVPGYPYSESGQFYEEAPIERHEQLIGMAWIAAKTSRIRLVPLHRGFDDLIEARPQRRQGGWVDEQLDAACNAGLASD